MKKFLCGAMFAGLLASPVFAVEQQGEAQTQEIAFKICNETEEETSFSCSWGGLNTNPLFKEPVSVPARAVGDKCVEHKVPFKIGAFLMIKCSASHATAGVTIPGEKGATHHVEANIKYEAKSKAVGSAGVSNKILELQLDD